MASIFTKIINKEISAHIIAENNDFLAFLDINPLVLGHILLIPKIEVDYIFDIENNLLSKMIIFAKEIALAQKKVIDCKRIGVAVIGLEVPHAHIHLVPLNTVNDINFSLPKLKPTQIELENIAKKIRSQF